MLLKLHADGDRFGMDPRFHRLSVIQTALGAFDFFRRGVEDQEELAGLHVSLVLQELDSGSAGLAQPRTKKADVVEYPKVFDHVGLLFNEPPGTAELPSI
jgi:hypothetical protein